MYAYLHLMHNYLWVAKLGRDDLGKPSISLKRLFALWKWPGLLMWHPSIEGHPPTGKWVCTEKPVVMAQTSIDHALLVYKPWLLLLCSMKIYADWRWWHDTQAKLVLLVPSLPHITTLETAGSNLRADGVSRDWFVGFMVRIASTTLDSGARTCAKPHLYDLYVWSFHMSDELMGILWSWKLMMQMMVNHHLYGETGGWSTPGSTMLILMVDRWWLMMLPGEVLAASPVQAEVPTRRVCRRVQAAPRNQQQIFQVQMDLMDQSRSQHQAMLVAMAWGPQTFPPNHQEIGWTPWVHAQIWV